MTCPVPQPLYQVAANTDDEINAREISAEVLTEPQATANPEFGTYVMLALLILASIAGILLLCYKCEHPDWFQILRRE